MRLWLEKRLDKRRRYQAYSWPVEGDGSCRGIQESIEAAHGGDNDVQVYTEDINVHKREGTGHKVKDRSEPSIHFKYNNFSHGIAKKKQVE